MEAVRAAEEFFLAGGAEKNYFQWAMLVEMEDEAPEAAGQEQQGMPYLANILQGQMTVLTRLVDWLESQGTPFLAAIGQRQVECYQCGRTTL